MGGAWLYVNSFSVWAFVSDIGSWNAKQAAYVLQRRRSSWSFCSWWRDAYPGVLYFLNEPQTIKDNRIAVNEVYCTLRIARWPCWIHKWATKFPRCGHGLLHYVLRPNVGTNVEFCFKKMCRSTDNSSIYEVDPWSTKDIIMLENQELFIQSNT